MVDGSKVRLASGALAIVIDAQVGARVTEVGLAGVNLLTGPAVNQENWGSTFWPSPQGVWKDRWPPPPEIDNRPYTTTVTPDAVAFAGNRNDMLKLRANKTFALDSQAESIDITYQLLTDETAGVMAAPWEVTRLPCRGLVFFGVGAGARLDPLLVREGAAWLDLSALAAAPPKVVTDGTGWMAWVDAPSRTLFVKAYPDVAPAAFAPEESDTELFVADTKTYIELEAQGPYQKITPAAPVSWAVRWWVRRVPAGIDLTVGSAALVAYVHQTIGK